MKRRLPSGPRSGEYATRRGFLQGSLLGILVWTILDEGVGKMRAGKMREEARADGNKDEGENCDDEEEEECDEEQDSD